MEKLSEDEELVTIEELQEQTFEAIREAYNSTERKVHIIKSMTGAGKSTASKMIKPYTALIETMNEQTMIEGV